MIEDQIPEDALRQLSLREYATNWEWLEAVGTVTRAEEDFREQKSLRGGGRSGATRGEKRNLVDVKPTVAAKPVKKEYRGKEKAHCQKKKAGERRVKKEGSVAPAEEVKQTVWAEAHTGVD